MESSFIRSEAVMQIKRIAKDMMDSDLDAVPIVRATNKEKRVLMQGVLKAMVILLTVGDYDLLTDLEEQVLIAKLSTRIH
jgi:hypothetical protein